MSDASRILANAVETVPKLTGPGNYVAWARAVTLDLKMADVWDVITQPRPTGGERATKWTKLNNICCVFLSKCCDTVNQRIIENINIASDAWKKLKDANEPKGYGFVHEAWTTLLQMKAEQFDSVRDYCAAFQDAYADLQRFKGPIEISPVGLIIQLHNGLGPELQSYVEKFNHEHDPFDEAGNPKYSLEQAILLLLSHRAFRNENDSFAMTTSTSVAPNNPGKPIRLDPQQSLTPGHVVDIVKSVRFCNIADCPDPYWHDKTNHAFIMRKRAEIGNKRRKSYQTENERVEDFRTGKTNVQQQ